MSGPATRRGQASVDAVIGLAAALSLGGCADAGVAWEFAVDPAVSGATIVGASIRRGRCAEGNPSIASYFFARGDQAPVDPVSLGEGEFCFEVELYASDCTPVGFGETDASLPPDGIDVVRIEVLPTVADEADARCLTYQSTTGD